MSNFKAETVSDQKRLARGQHWLAVRSALRVAHHAHQKPWRILILAGGAPEGEIRAIREVMPKAHITAVDTDAACCEAAAVAGADVTHCGDVMDLAEKEFDAVCLDFCGPVSSAMSQAVRAFFRRAYVVVVNFCYGRDVKEVAIDALEKAERGFKSDTSTENAARILSTGMPRHVAARVYSLLRSMAPRLRSVIIYAGNEMPMCSCLLTKGGKNARLSYVALAEGDFELAVLDTTNVSNLYDCPQERIEALRRREVALRAVQTRRAREAA